VTGRADQLAAARAIAGACYEPAPLLAHLANEIPAYRFRGGSEAARMLRAAEATVGVLDRLPGERLAQRWQAFEATVW